MASESLGPTRSAPDAPDRGRVGPGDEVVGGTLDHASPTPPQAASRAHPRHSMGGPGISRPRRRAARKPANGARLAGSGSCPRRSRRSAISAAPASRRRSAHAAASRIPTASCVRQSSSAPAALVEPRGVGIYHIAAPRWVQTLAQPIAVEDVVDYLLAVLEFDRPADAIYEVGGDDQVSYADIIREYARQRGLHRRVIPTPLITPRASRRLLGLATPVYGRVAAAMVESLRNETIVNVPAARGAFAIRPRGLSAAIERALVNEDREFAETRWSDALPQPSPLHWGGLTFGRRLVTSRVMRVRLEPEEAFKPIQRIGGNTGWYAANWFWRLRGLLDTSGVVSGCAVAGAIQKTCGMATPSTSGASNASRRDV